MRSSTFLSTALPAASRRTTSRCRLRWLAPSPRRQVRLLARLCRWVLENQQPVDLACLVGAR